MSTVDHKERTGSSTTQEEPCHDVHTKCLDGTECCTLPEWKEEECFGCILGNVDYHFWSLVLKMRNIRMTFDEAVSLRDDIVAVKKYLVLSSLLMEKRFPEYAKKQKEIWEKEREKARKTQEDLHKKLTRFSSKNEDLFRV